MARRRKLQQIFTYSTKSLGRIAVLAGILLPVLTAGKVPAKRIEVMRLETGDAVVQWTVSEGYMEEDKDGNAREDSYKPKRIKHYKVDLDKAIISRSDLTAKLGFNLTEAQEFKKEVTLILQYLAVKTDWFEEQFSKAINQEKKKQKRSEEVTRVKEFKKLENINFLCPGYFCAG